MPRRGTAGKPTRREAALMEWAVALGAPGLSVYGARRLLGELGDDGARLRVAELVIVAQACREIGVEHTMQRLGSMRAAAGSGLEAARRLRYKVRRRASLGGPTCRRRGPVSIDANRRNDAYAACGCGACIAHLAASLDRYAGALARRIGPWFLGFVEAKDEARSMLFEALISWPQDEGKHFAAWYGACVRTRFMAMGVEKAKELRRLGPMAALNEEIVAG